MNCSQLLERRATTNWEKSASSLRNLEAHLNELRPESRPWGVSRPTVSSSSDRILAQRPASSARIG
jgi:hypothetical protein